LNSTALGANAFQNGTLTLIFSLKSLVVTGNTANSISVRNDNFFSTVSIRANSLFRLYDDDDDFNDDGGNLNGDDSEDVGEPNRTMLQSVDTSCPDVITASNCNVLASAYIRPEEDLTGNQGNVPFSLNVSDMGIDNLVQIYFQDIGSESSQDFWTIYLFGAYQHLITEDSDPDVGDAKYGTTGTIESTIFMELGRAREYEDIDNGSPPGVDVWRNRPVANKFTTVHEVGHLFGADHFDGGSATTDYGIMGLTITRTSAIYNDYSIKIIRMATNP